MPDSSKPTGKSVAESPVAEVTENGRQPSSSEQQWAENALAPTLEKSPEKPIGAPTGVNLDEEMSKMLDLEHSYAASSKLITAVSNMYTALFQVT